jgi:hypothetical protein
MRLSHWKRRNVMKKFTRTFIHQYEPADNQFVAWLTRTAPADMPKLWDALLDWQQDSSIILEKRIEWALWLVGRTNGAGALAELAWRFASEVYAKMPSESQKGMDSIRRCLDGDQNVDVEQIKESLWATVRAEVQVRMGVTYKAAHSAAKAADAVGAANAEDVEEAEEAAVRTAEAAAWTEKWEHMMRKRQLQIIWEQVKSKLL